MNKEKLFEYIEEYLEYQAKLYIKQNPEFNEEDDLQVIIESKIIPELKLELAEYLGGEFN